MKKTVQILSILLGSTLLVFLVSSFWINGNTTLDFETLAQLLIVPGFQFLILWPLLSLPRSELYDREEFRRALWNPPGFLLLSLDILLLILTLAGAVGLDIARRQSPAALYLGLKAALLVLLVSEELLRRRDRSRIGMALMGCFITWICLDRLWDLGSGSIWGIPVWTMGVLGLLLLFRSTRASRSWLVWTHLMMGPAAFLLLVQGPASSGEQPLWTRLGLNLLNLGFTFLWISFRRSIQSGESWQGPSGRESAG